MNFLAYIRLNQCTQPIHTDLNAEPVHCLTRIDHMPSSLVYRSNRSVQAGFKVEHALNVIILKKKGSVIKCHYHRKKLIIFN